MSTDADRPDEFEQHAQRVLGESVTRVSGHVRSRLNQARQAALAEIEARPRSFWRMPAILPAAGAAAAAALVAVVLMTHQGGGLRGVVAQPAISKMSRLASRANCARPELAEIAQAAIVFETPLQRLHELDGPNPAQVRANNHSRLGIAIHQALLSRLLAPCNT